MQTLQRRLGIPGAAAIGVASMLGAGVFFVWAPATAAAGGAVLIALPIAAAIAALNAASTIRLAMRHPVSGGAYAYGRAELGELPGFIAGCLFLLGKIASVAAIGLIAGGYLWPGSERIVAIGLIVVLAGLNATGVRTTAAVSGLVAAIVVVVLIVVLVVGLGATYGDTAPAVVWAAPGANSVAGVLGATGLIFFAFAGYARIATLGEEVRDPQRTLPRAALLSIGVVFLLSAATLVVLLYALGTERLAESGSPLLELLARGWDPLVRGAVALACIGSMTGVLAGLSRTAMAMSRDGELPGPLARVAIRTATPVVADLAIAVVAIVAVLLLDPAATVGISACAVLGYYAIAHLSALRAGPSLGLVRVIPVLGLVGCLVVSLSTPWPGVVGVVMAIAIAVGARALARRVRRA